MFHEWFSLSKLSRRVLLLVLMLNLFSLNGFKAYINEDLDDDDFEIEKNEFDDPDITEVVVKLKRESTDDDLVFDLFRVAHSLETVDRVFEFERDNEDSSLFHFRFASNDNNKKRRKRSANSKREFDDKIETLRSDDRVEYAIPQPYLTREKRRAIEYLDDDELNAELDRLFDDLLLKDKDSMKKRNEKDDKRNKIEEISIDNSVPTVDKKLDFNDEKFNQEWYLINRGQLLTPAGHDLNVKEAWLQGYTGKNITIVIIDDGLDHEHPDFSSKYKPEYSYDYNELNDTSHDPMPSTFDGENSHGTKCAGAAAASANNSVCGVGVAYDAYIAAIRILDGPITDVLEGRALSYQSRNVDIKSASWGPKDDGAHMEYPGMFVNLALEEGVANGRNGKGTLFIWASGNGGGNDDDCSCDGYVSNWNVISIGSVNHRGRNPYFMEKCPSTMAVVYSGGSVKIGEPDIDDPIVRVVTADVRGKCSTNFQGTSAAAPLAAGAIALVLEANPNLGYRDVMYLIARTSRIPNTVDDGWIVNGANYHVNEKFGFGVLDISQLIQEAQTWENVPERQSCYVESDQQSNANGIPSSGKIELSIVVTDCPKVEQLEHVVANISFTFSLRGDLKLTLISPAGTPSEILSYRRYDLNKKGITFFPFMTLFNWGESPIGTWKLIVESKSRNTNSPNFGTIDYFALKFFGTTQKQNQKLNSRLVNNNNEAYALSSDEVREIYDTEKKLSHNARIINREVLDHKN